jgi:hypothetical protein
MNYEIDITIDEGALDVEWLEQPRLMLKYARNAAEARKALDEAKEKLDFVKADLDRKIRTDPEDYGLMKVTEPTVAAAIFTCDEYKEANKDYIQAKFDADIAQGATFAFNARKDALENLVRLHGQQYFAGPKIPRDLAWEKKAHDEKVNAGIASKLTRRRT